MENNNGPLGQPAHNDPKQKLSYFENQNHVESRNLDNKEGLNKSQQNDKKAESVSDLQKDTTDSDKK